MYLLLRWFLNALALMLLAQLVPGISVSSFYAALIAALILGLVNALIRPILFLLTLPVTIVTLGLFALVLNALLLWFVGTIVKGFTVEGFFPALVGSIILWAVSVVTNQLLASAEEA